MYTYAVLGGTGSTGAAVIEQLIAAGSPGTIHIYARSKSRLLAKVPHLLNHILDKGDGAGDDLPKAAQPNVRLFIGDMSDETLMAACLADTEVVFQTIATNVCKPGCHVAQDAAKVCVSAITKARSASAHPETYSPPTILFLSSASCSPKLSQSQGKLAHWFLHIALYEVYHDLELAQSYLASESNKWIPHVIVCPNGLSSGRATGHTIGLEPSQVPGLSYADLGGAMIQIAEEKDKWKGEMVQAAAGEMPKDFEFVVLARYLLIGLLCGYARPLWWMGRKAGWW